jgi:hypothetical protein
MNYIVQQCKTEMGGAPGGKSAFDRKPEKREGRVTGA